MEIVARKSLGGLTPEEHAEMRRSDRARHRAVLANDLIMTGPAWEWLEALCVQEAEALEDSLLDPNRFVDQRHADRIVAAAGVYRQIPQKIVRYRDEYNRAVRAANKKPTIEEA